MKKTWLSLSVFLLLALFSAAQQASQPLPVTVMVNSEALQGTRTTLRTSTRFRFVVNDPTQNTGVKYEFGKIWITALASDGRTLGTGTEFMPPVTMSISTRAFSISAADLKTLPSAFSLRLEGMTRVYPDGRREAVNLDPAGTLFFVMNPSGGC